ncbi:hypothetical protein ACFRKB_33870 [Streptomyces scopuliridis]|uniref:hypothetical protein n=1 Tax=Streptomyces scopuliridis TaxID=452529 RepID=UPI003673D16F
MNIPSLALRDVTEGLGVGRDDGSLGAAFLDGLRVGLFVQDMVGVEDGEVVTSPAAVGALPARSSAEVALGRKTPAATPTTLIVITLAMIAVRFGLLEGGLGFSIATCLVGEMRMGGPRP